MEHGHVDLVALLDVQLELFVELRTRCAHLGARAAHRHVVYVHMHVRRERERARRLKRVACRVVGRLQIVRIDHFQFA